MTVHEWGTFTVLQDENGNAIGGINTDDEPLPNFVHDLRRMLMQSPSEVPPVYFKGAPRCHPDVIVRLETPVIYFHPPAGTDSNTKTQVDVNVEIRGGWLTQFYPDATPAESVAGSGSEAERARPTGEFGFGHITPRTIGSLTWSALEVGGQVNGPTTTSPVWLAPRRVRCAPVTATNGESERYLFYRGVGHVDSPLRVSRDTDNTKLLIRSRFDEMGEDFRAGRLAKRTVGPLWLVDVRPDGSCAYATHEPVDVSQGDQKVIGSLPAWFDEQDYAFENLFTLRKDFSAALVRDGLNADEAEALLNTWEASYFKRPGLRLFYLVPRQWTDQVLPLHIKGVSASDIHRVMVGRIEIVTPAQRQLLRRLSANPPSNPHWLDAALKKANAGREDFYREKWYQEVMDGTKLLSSMNLEMPADYRAYLEVGRFRNALILDELAKNPGGNLGRFVEAYDLGAYQPEEGKAK